jgi:hypothetical protein
MGVRGGFSGRTASSRRPRGRHRVRLHGLVGSHERRPIVSQAVRSGCRSRLRSDRVGRRRGRRGPRERAASRRPWDGAPAVGAGRGNTERAIDDLRAADRALGRGGDSLGAAWARPAWLVPGLSQNTRALHDFVGEVGELAQAGAIAAERGPIDSLRARDGQVDLAAVAATEGPLVDVIDQLRRSRGVIEHLRDRFLVPPVADRIDELRGELDDAIPSAELALEGVRVAPSLLGGDGPRTYLVLFTTPVEGRAHLGFPGNFAEITFTDGRFEKSRFGRVSELVNHPGPRSLSGPAEFLQRYGRFNPAEEWRSLTFSPDLPTVAQAAAELYPQSGGRPVDGVVTVDPFALAALLNFTGPMPVPGLPDLLTPETAADFLLRGQYLDLPDNPQRIDALETLSDRTFDQLTTSDLPPPRDLRAIFGPIVEQGHLQVVAFDDRGGRFLERLGITGALPPVEGDALAVTTSNSAMNKIDLFLKRSLDYDVTWHRDTGEVEATATITLTNDSPASGLPKYVIGNLVGGNRPGGENLPDGSNLVFLTLYSPWGVESSTLDGEPLPLEVLPELGRNAITTLVELGPGQSRTITVELRGFLRQRGYVLDLAAQPLVTPERTHVRIRAVGGPDLSGTGPVEISGKTAEGELDLVRDERIRLE